MHSRSERAKPASFLVRTVEWAQRKRMVPLIRFEMGGTIFSEVSFEGSASGQ